MIDEMLFRGMQIVESAYLEQDGEPVTVRRSWRQRLLTWPWRPWIATTTFVPRVPYRGAMRVDARTLLMHPATYRELKRQLSKES